MNVKPVRVRVEAEPRYPRVLSRVWLDDLEVIGVVDVSVRLADHEGLGPEVTLVVHPGSLEWMTPGPSRPDHVARPPRPPSLDRTTSS